MSEELSFLEMRPLLSWPFVMGLSDGEGIRGGGGAADVEGFGILFKKAASC